MACRAGISCLVRRIARDPPHTVYPLGDALRHGSIGIRLLVIGPHQIRMDLIDPLTNIPQSSDAAHPLAILRDFVYALALSQVLDLRGKGLFNALHEVAEEQAYGVHRREASRVT